MGVERSRLPFIVVPPRKNPHDGRKFPVPFALTLIVVWSRLVPRVPGYIVALVAGTAMAAFLDLDVDAPSSCAVRYRSRPA